MCWVLVQALQGCHSAAGLWRPFLCGLEGCGQSHSTTKHCSLPVTTDIRHIFTAAHAVRRGLGTRLADARQVLGHPPRPGRSPHALALLIQELSFHVVATSILLANLLLKSVQIEVLQGSASCNIPFLSTPCVLTK